MKTTVCSFIPKMSRLMGGLVALLSVCAGVAASDAAVNGALRGCVTTTEARTNPSTADTGLLWTSRPGDVVRIRRVLLRLQIPGGSTPNFYTLTDDNGCYRIAWNDNNRSSFPVSAQLTVIWASPNMGLNTQQTTSPGRRFTITDGPLYFDLTTNQAVNLNANSTRNVNVISGEKEAAYLTAEEFYARVVRQSTTFLNTMNGVYVHINASPFSAVTPTANDVYLSGGTAVTRAFTVAHELGHIVAWRSLGLALAPFRADFLDYMCFDGDPTHSFISLECEKAAWNEGLANFMATAWMWARSAPNPRIPVFANGSFNLESDACTNPGRNNEGCQAKALWDIYDSRIGDDDGISNRSMISITQVLRGYPDNCLFPFPGDNNCSNEGSPLGLNSFDLNALNHFDFRANWATVIGAAQIPQINAIYTQNSVIGGDLF